MKRVCIIGFWVVALTIASGVVFPVLTKPSNCGGNSAAMAACRNVGLAIRIISADRGTNLVSLSGLSAAELREFQDVPGLSWLHGAHLLVRTNGLLLGGSGPRQVIVVCDTPFSNVPQYRVGHAPPTHAIGDSDGSVGLVSAAQFQSFDLRTFEDINRLAETTRVEPPAGGNAE